MTEAEIESELQNLHFQLVLLQEEHAKTRFGWLYFLRNTGFLLMVLGISMFIGVLQVHGKIESNPVAMTLGLMGTFMFLIGVWVAIWSLRPLAERLMKVAPRW
jgi:hypothetical protein